jgi:hypothetical protein
MRNIRPKQLNGANRRLTAVADRDCERLNWAEEADLSRRRGVRPDAELQPAAFKKVVNNPCRVCDLLEEDTHAGR